MKFLLDENIPPRAADCIGELGHSARHINHLGMSGTVDGDIFLLAEREDEIIVTHDNDFSAIHAFSGKSKPSVILFRHQVINLPIICDVLTKVIGGLSVELAEGVFVSVDEKSVRSRRLPIRPM
jgi:predicted nuclease of predicted toxin-antitoxin system